MRGRCHIQLGWASGVVPYLNITWESLLTISNEMLSCLRAWVIRAGTFAKSPQLTVRTRGRSQQVHTPFKSEDKSWCFKSDKPSFGSSPELEWPKSKFATNEEEERKQASTHLAHRLGSYLGASSSYRPCSLVSRNFLEISTVIRWFVTYRTDCQVR